jgi:purine-nucleoside phosphorylase
MRRFPLFDADAVKAASESLAIRLPFRPDVALVLGSGLSAVTDGLVPLAEIPFSGVENIPAPGVEGHCGKFLLARTAGKTVLFASGRIHLYEGWSAFEVSLSVAAMAGAGAKALVLTNAAGGIRTDLAPGMAMAISDHVSLQSASPLEGCPGSSRFVSMSNAWDRPWREELRAKTGIPEGVYLAVRGPQYETPAEIRAFRSLGADAVGMSTAAEAIMARYCGMKLLGLSLVTNFAAGLSVGALNHQEVVETALESHEHFRDILLKAVELA